MLAYVFWHTPAAGVDLAAYEASLSTFHQSLDAVDVEGFHSSAAFAVAGATWAAGPAVYEDWYLVADFTALGRLNAAAVAGRRQQPHDSVAHMSGTGIAGLYASRDDVAAIPQDPTAVWFAKPAGEPYDDLFSRIGDDGSLWQRQLTLGPTPEFCLFDGADTPADALVVTRRTVQWRSNP